MLLFRNQCCHITEPVYITTLYNFCGLQIIYGYTLICFIEENLHLFYTILCTFYTISESNGCIFHLISVIAVGWSDLYFFPFFFSLNKRKKTLLLPFVIQEHIFFFLSFDLLLLTLGKN